MKRSCGTCNMSEGFRLTPTGRFARETIGRCNYEIPIPVLPASVHDRRANPFPKGGVQPNGGEECPVYVPKDEPGAAGKALAIKEHCEKQARAAGVMVDAPCPTCGEAEPFTGTCGTSLADTKALCNRARPWRAGQRSNG